MCGVVDEQGPSRGPERKRPQLRGPEMEIVVRALRRLPREDSGQPEAVPIWDLALAAGTNAEVLAAQAAEFGVPANRACLAGEHPDVVADLAARWNLPCTIARLDDIEASLPTATANPSARYRAARFALFRQVIDAHHLQGVILAHHAADQAETVFQRLLRGDELVPFYRY